MGVYVVTGGSGGIGGKTVEILRSQGHEVVNVDLKDSDICANLATKEGRDEVIHTIHAQYPDAVSYTHLIVPLVVSAAPFIARMVETSLAEVDAGVVEAAQSMGASRLQIVWKVYLPEAVPSLILGASISIITILGYTAIAGAVGAGGLGDLAIRYGYQRRVPEMMWVTVIFIIVLVQIIQSLFSWLSTKLDKRLR